MLREFASTLGDSRFYATTPFKIAVEMLRMHEVQEGHGLIYNDLHPAFTH